MLLFFTFTYLFINVLIGFWAARRVQNASDFVVAGRGLSLGVASTSIFATWFGSEAVMSSSVEFTQGGFLAVIKDPFGAVLCLLLIALFFVRPLYRLNIVTFSDYFRLRFGPKAEFWSAGLMSFSYLGWIAAQLQASGIIICALTEGTSLAMSLEVAVLFSAIVVALYTSVGGMWAVSLTDFVQTVVIITGLVLVLLLLYLALPNGLAPVLSKQPEGFFSLAPKDYSWQGSMQYFLAWITVGWGSIPQQDVFQRTMSARTEGIAVRSVYLAAFLYLTLTMLPLFIGLLGNELYPEILANSPDKEAAQMLLPKIVLQHSPVWIQIIFFGAIISAIMSTTSGAILSPATLVVENLIKPRRPQLEDRQLLSILRWTVVAVTAVSVWMALSGSTIYELAASSSTSILVTLFVPLVAGVYWPGATGRAALISMISGALVYYGQDWLFPDLGVSAVLSGLLASGVGMVVGRWL